MSYADIDEIPEPYELTLVVDGALLVIQTDGEPTVKRDGWMSKGGGKLSIVEFKSTTVVALDWDKVSAWAWRKLPQTYGV